MTESKPNVLIQILHTLRYLISSMNPSHKSRLALALFLMIFTGALANIPAVALGKLLDRIVQVGQINFATVRGALLLIIGAALFREILQVYRKFIVEDTCTRIEKISRVKVADHLLKLDILILRGTLSGSLHGRLNRSLEGQIKLIKLAFLDFLPAMCIAIGAIIVAFSQVSIIGVIITLVIPIGFYIVFRQIKTQQGIRLSLLRAKDTMDGKIVEVMAGIENVRAFNSTAFEIGQVSNIAEQVRAKEIKHHVSMALYDSGKSINETVFQMVVLITGLLLAHLGKISTGQILTVTMLYASVVSPLREIHRILDEAHESTLRVNDLEEFLSLRPDISYDTIKVSTANRSRYGKSDCAVYLKDLVHTFPGATMPSIDQVSLTVRNGEYVGICGAAGCGKSTLFRLLLRIIHASSGEIELLGKNILEYMRSELAQYIVLITQQPFLFSGSIYDNIAYGVENVSPSMVEEAAKLACIHDEIVAMADKYESKAGERGERLSGGQRQRIGLARLFLRKPDIILLDEPTSALDGLNEQRVVNNILNTFGSSTILAIAHRLSTLRPANKVVVMADGRIEQIGTYDELLETDGLFRKLAQSRPGDGLLRNHDSRFVPS